LPIFGAGTRGAASHSRASEEAFGGGAGAHSPALPKIQPAALGGGGGRLEDLKGSGTPSGIGGGGGGGLEHHSRATRSTGAPSGIGGSREDEIEDCVEGGAGGGGDIGGGGGGPSASPAVRSSDGGRTDLSNDPSLSFPTMGSRTGS